MRYLKLKSLPVLKYAHSVKSTNYQTNIPILKEKNVIEFCYPIDGDISAYYDGEYVLQKQYNIACNLYDKVTKVKCDGYHEYFGISFYADYEIVSTPEKNCLLLPLLVPCSERTKAHDILDKIIKTNTIEPENTFAINGLILLFLSEYSYLANHTASQKNSSYSIYVYKAKKYVYDKLNYPITQNEVAKHLGITPEYLSYLFKKHTGVPFMKFVNNAKLTKIKDIMEKDNLKLYQCAEMYGYNDANYVSKLFKKYYNKNITDN